jgi:predicted Zn-dependent protease
MSQSAHRVRRKRNSKSSRGRREQVVPAFVLAALILLGFVLGIFVFTYGRKGYNRWQESRLLKQANEMLRRGDLNGADHAARNALEIHRDSLPAYHALAEITEKKNSAETVAWRAEIAKLQPQILDNQLNLASAALRFGQFDIARKALGRVTPGDRDKAAYHIVAGWLARSEGNTADEEQHFAAAVNQEPSNELYQFNLAVLQILSPDPEKNARARDTLERLSKATAFRTAALRALLDNALRQNQLQPAEGLAQDLQMSPQVSFSDYLICLQLYRKLVAAKVAALLDKVKPVAARNPADLAELLNWMNKNDLAAEVLKWIEKLPPDLITKPPAAVSVAEALAKTKSWSRLKRWTRTGTWGDTEYLRLAYRAYAARQLRQASADAEFTALWRAAEHEVGENPDRELSLARLATEWNLTTEAEQLWQRVAKNPPTRREALDALYQIYRASNDLPNLSLTAQRLHESSPEEEELTADAARFALLLDHNTPEGQRLAKEAYDKAPDHPACVVTYAFSLSVSGRTFEGIEILKKLPTDQLRDPRVAAYYAVLLADENQVDAAREYAAIARAGSTFLEEKKMLDEAIAKLPSPTPAPSPVELPSSTPVPSPSPAGGSLLPSPPPPALPPTPGLHRPAPHSQLSDAQPLATAAHR